MNERGLPEEDVRRLLDGFYSRDCHFPDGRVLGSMCTAPHPLAVEAHMRFIEANLGNAGLYPGTAEMESQVIGMLGRLMSNPDASGHIIGGGTEANITALWTARNLSKRRKVIFGESAHFSFNKAMDLLNLESVPVPLDDEFRVDASEVEARITDDTLAIIAVAGTTELGQIDPVEELAGIAGDDVHLHVDAAFGGFVLPFLKRLGADLPPFDFVVEGVNSMSLDPHKMGLSTIPAGAILFRAREAVERITVEAPYLTVSDQRSLSGTRSSAAVAGAYAVMMHLGLEGYDRVVNECMDNTRLLARGVQKLGCDLVMEPIMNIVAFHHDDPALIKDAMARRGWQISMAKHPRAVRLVVMPHIRRSNIESFLSDLKDAV